MSASRWKLVAWGVASCLLVAALVRGACAPRRAALRGRSESLRSQVWEGARRPGSALELPAQEAPQSRRAAAQLIRARELRARLGSAAESEILVTASSLAASSAREWPRAAGEPPSSPDAGIHILASDPAWEEVVQAYRLVHLWYGDCRELSAQAAFRAGEMLRAAGDQERAREEFEVACDKDAAAAVRREHGMDFGVRARLELGHLARRSGEPLGALQHYEEVAMSSSASTRRRAEARFWYARMSMDTGDLDAARRWFAGVAQAAESEVDPLLRLRAFDFWARTYVRDEDVGAAVGVLELCRSELAPFIEERSELGARVCAAFVRMHARQQTRELIRARHEQLSR